MSGFEDPNPLADPFGDPFGDLFQGANQPKSVVNGTPTSQFSGSSALPQPPPPPPYTPNSQAPTLSQAELQRRQKELERKEAELAAREEALKKAETNIKENNWPSYKDAYHGPRCSHTKTLPLEELQRALQWLSNVPQDRILFRCQLIDGRLPEYFIMASKGLFRDFTRLIDAWSAEAYPGQSWAGAVIIPKEQPVLDGSWQPQGRISFDGPETFDNLFLTHGGKALVLLVDFWHTHSDLYITRLKLGDDPDRQYDVAKGGETGLDDYKTENICIRCAATKIGI